MHYLVVSVCSVEIVPLPSLFLIKSYTYYYPFVFLNLIIVLSYRGTQAFDI